MGLEKPTAARYVHIVQKSSTIIFRLIPVFIAVAVMFFQRCSSEKFVNEAGRAARVGLTRDEESLLGLQSYRDVVGRSRTITSGPQHAMVVRCAERLASKTGAAGTGFSRSEEHTSELQSR